MTVAAKPRALDWFELASAGLHKTKIAVLEVVAEGGNVPVSPSDLAVSPRVLASLDGVGAPLGVVSYHVRQLVEKGLLELVRTEPRRGALLHFYRLPARAMVSPAQQARRALARSASKMAGAPEPLTGEVLARAYVRALESRDPIGQPWESLPDSSRMLIRSVFDELLAGVAGA